LSLSPLISHAVALRTTLRDLTAAAAPPPGPVTENFRAWSEEFATARDLVGRLVPPPGAADARDTAVLGAMFYRESALTMASAGAGTDIASWRTAATRASHLRVIGDRLFDASRRLLAAAGVGTAPVIADLPDPVPDFGRNDPQPPAEAGRAVSAKGWFKQHSGQLRQTAAAVAPISRGEAAPAAPTLAALTAALRGPLPAQAAPAEAVVLVRLSLLAAAEAVAPFLPDVSTRDGQYRLRILAGELLNLGRRKLARAGIAASDPGFSAVVTTPGDAALLRSGGRFGGNPPRLNPGDPPDLGVPGGLHLPDPVVLLQQ